jgi:glutamate-1-semialdehyde 2,1-aminomutase
MAAGLATLRVLARDDAWRRLEETGAALEAALTPVLAQAPFPAQLVRIGSLFWTCLQGGPPPRSAAAVDPNAASRYRPVFHALLRRGVAVAPSAYEVGFLSLAHTPAHIERFRDALAAALHEPVPPSA